MAACISHRARVMLLATAFALPAAPIQVEAQRSGRVAGRVLDALTNAPVIDATVSVVGSALAVGTGEDGHFAIDSVTPGLVRFQAMILGYHPITTDYYTVLPDTTIDVDFKLAPLAYELEAVEVTGRDPAREWSSVRGALVLTREQLPERGSVLDALHGLVPGVRTRGMHEDARLVVRGAEADVLYVLDGHVIRPPLTFYVDAGDVDCVEIRKGFSAVMEFKPSIVGENYAGVVLIWTTGYVGPRPRQCVRGQG